LRIFIILVLSFIITLQAINTYYVSASTLKAIEKKYGKKAKQRVLLWDKMLQKAKGQKILVKLKLVNDFFNRVKYISDKKHWRKNDYWASPFEFLGTGAGDCEDYAIAKYFALRKLGVPDSKLKITYVKLLRRGTRFEEAHMVLNYYHKPNSIPIVLDNVNKKMKLATKRKDLKPIYSFNAAGLWQAKNRGRTIKKVGANNLKNWKSLMKRI